MVVWRSIKLISPFASDHTHHQWQNTIANVAVEAIAEELSPYNELFTTVILQQVHGAAATSCFRVSAAANLVMDEF